MAIATEGPTFSAASNVDASGSIIAKRLAALPARTQEKDHSLKRDGVKRAAMVSALQDAINRTATERSELNSLLAHRKRERANGYVQFSAEDDAETARKEADIDRLSADI